MPNTAVQATLAQGVVTGSREEGVCRFDAIPYGQAPLGALRFRPPVPAEWTGALDATRRGPVAPQLPSRLRGAMGDFDAAQSEDCLHLTVWTPAPDKQRRPVAVWLHGGAFQSGAGALDWYCGARLAARGDMVVVAVNYRLAALGWLALPGQTANVGLLDQELAIKWVHDNIASFGGEPQRITVMGQSAGGSSVACLLLRKPRFQRAILQSASLGRPLRDATQAGEIGEIFLRAAGADSLEHARAIPFDRLLQAQQASPVVDWLAREGASRALFGPVADGDVLPLDAPDRLAMAGGSIDSLAAYTLDELAAFPEAGLVPEVRAMSDKVFGAPARRWAAHAIAQGRRAWSSRFDIAPNADFRACHCIELPFVFDTLAAFGDAPMLRGLQPDVARRMADQVQTAWIGFIRDGDPGWAPWPHEKVFC